MLVRVLLALDEPAVGDRLARLLPEGDAEISRRRAADFWRQPDREPFDLAVVLREELPEAAGAAIARLRELADGPEVIVLHRDADAADSAGLQAAGCFAIVPRDLGDRPLKSTLATLVERRRQALVTGMRAAQAPAPRELGDLVTRSEATRRLLKMARRVAASDTSLLILGETGAGKEWLARAIHHESPRAAGPFIAVNCAAVPESLLESELFGHEKGAFTGAIRARRGYFELAHRGTLFLDEVAELPTHLQVKLLRALQDCRIQRLGSEREIEVDGRIIAATNRDLVAAMKEGIFRQDLYYRLAVVTLQVPPLRQRREDIPELVRTQLRQLVRKLGRPEITGVAPRAMEALAAYDWPGNVRELMNVLERAALLAESSELDLDDLPPEVAGRGSQSRPAPESAGLFAGGIEEWLDQPLEAGRQALVTEFERRYLEGLLERCGGSVGRTAAAAGVDPRTLYNKMRQLGLRKERFKG